MSGSDASYQEILDSITEESGFSDYYSAFKKLQELPPPDNAVRTRIAILSSFTVEPLRAVLDVACRKVNVVSEIMVGGFNQYAQEILNASSHLYAFSPEMIILLLDSEILFGDFYHFPYRYSAEDRRQQVNQQAMAIRSLLSQLRNKLQSLVVLNTLEVPFHGPMGILEGKVDYGFADMIRDFNRQLFTVASKDSGAYVFDLDNWAAQHGKASVYDVKMKHLGQLRISTAFYPDLANHYLRYVKALKGLARKCIVVDLDNVLWGGIVGEDGPEGIRLGGQAPGSAYVEFQKVLLNFYERGILIAINSKNNPEDAWEIINNHPNMILRKRHFAAVRINWQDKAANMREIAKELDLGLSGFVFFDDNPAERLLVRRELPEVCVPEFPPDPSSYARILNSLGEFDLLQLTDEDVKRAAFYSQKRQADELQTQFTDVLGFLKALAMTCEVQVATAYNMSRIAQLTQKTNQFNLTTRRYSLDEIKKMAASANFMVNAYSVADRFGDQGIVGVTIVRKEPRELCIDTFLLSCRVLGRQIDRLMLGTVLRRASEAKVGKIYGEYIATPKNGLAKNFYKENGFTVVSSGNGTERLVYDTSRPYAIPNFIAVTEEK